MFENVKLPKLSNINQWAINWLTEISYILVLIHLKFWCEISIHPFEIFAIIGLFWKESHFFDQLNIFKCHYNWDNILILYVSVYTFKFLMWNLNTFLQDVCYYRSISKRISFYDQLYIFGGHYNWDKNKVLILY